MFVFNQLHNKSQVSKTEETKYSFNQRNLTWAIVKRGKHEYYVLNSNRRPAVVAWIVRVSLSFS